jgi:hypothetical protein
MLVHCSSPVSLDDRQGAAEVSSLHTPGAGMASLAPHCTRVQAVRQDVNWIHMSTLTYRCRKEFRSRLDSKVYLPNSLCRIPIPHHIKIPAHIWSTKYR